MTIELFIIALTACSLITGLVTEAVKKLLDEANKTYRSNLLAAICAVITAAITVVAYTLIAEVAVTVPFITTGVILIIMSWLCAMVGYDKVTQTIEQIIKKK